MPAGSVNYCDSCSKRISTEEEKSGVAIVTAASSLCGACAAAARDSQRKSDPASRAITKAPPPRRPKAAREVPAAKGNQVALMVVGILIGVGIGVFLLLAGGKRNGDRQPERAPAQVSQTSPAKAPIAGVKSELGALLARKDVGLTRYDEIRTGLLGLLDRSLESEHAGDIRAALAAIDNEHAALADADLAQIRRQALKLASEGRGDEALRAMDDFSKRYASGPWLPTRGRHAIASVRAEVASVPVVVSGDANEIVIQYGGTDNYNVDKPRGSDARGPVKDTLISRRSPTNNGMQSWYEMRVYGYSNAEEYGLIEFKLPDVHPGLIAEARLELYCHNAAGAVPIAAYPLLKSWNNTSQGGAFDFRDPSVPWNPGSSPSSFNPDPATTNDFDASRGVLNSDVRRDRWASWDITDVARSWLDNTLENNGVVLICRQTDGAARLFSTNVTPSDDKREGVIGLRPRLILRLRR